MKPNSGKGHKSHVFCVSNRRKCVWACTVIPLHVMKGLSSDNRMPNKACFPPVRLLCTVWSVIQSLVSDPEIGQHGFKGSLVSFAYTPGGIFSLNLCTCHKKALNLMRYHSFWNRSSDGPINHLLFLHNKSHSYCNTPSREFKAEALTLRLMWVTIIRQQWHQRGGFKPSTSWTAPGMTLHVLILGNTLQVNITSPLFPLCFVGNPEIPCQASHRRLFLQLQAEHLGFSKPEYDIKNKSSKGCTSVDVWREDCRGYLYSSSLHSITAAAAYGIVLK